MRTHGGEMRTHGGGMKQYGHDWPAFERELDVIHKDDDFLKRMGSYYTVDKYTLEIKTVNGVPVEEYMKPPTVICPNCGRMKGSHRKCPMCGN